MHRLRAFPRNTSFLFVELVPGRCLGSEIRLPCGREVFILNCHNEKLSVEHMGVIESYVRPIAERAAKRPNWCFLALIGDFNLGAQSGVAFNMLTGEVCDSVEPTNHHAARWKRITKDLLEVECPQPSHYNAGAEKLTCINRCFVSIASWATKYLKLGSTCSDPVKLWLDKLSDHGVMKVSVGLGPVVEPGFQTAPRVSPAIAKSSRLEQVLGSLLEAAQLGSLPAFQRLQLHK